jgi:hypothetical protein
MALGSTVVPSQTDALIRQDDRDDKFMAEGRVSLNKDRGELYYPSWTGRYASCRVADWESGMKSGPVALLMILIPTALAGCASKPPLSDSTIASMLRADRAAHCDRQTLHIRAGRFGRGYAARAEAWFDNTLLTDRFFRQVSENSDPPTTRGELSYRAGADTYRVSWMQSDLPYDASSSQLDITACIYVPKTIKVINASFKGETARVLFSEDQQLSLLGKRLRDAGLLQRYDPLGAPNGYEYTAVLGAFSSGTWRIMGVKVR